MAEERDYISVSTVSAAAGGSLEVCWGWKQQEQGAEALLGLSPIVL